MVHTDRGGQYCSAEYQALLKRYSLRGSMSAKGCCYDNACQGCVHMTWVGSVGIEVEIYNISLARVVI